MPDPDKGKDPGAVEQARYSRDGRGDRAVPVVTHADRRTAGLRAEPEGNAEEERRVAELLINHDKLVLRLRLFEKVWALRWNPPFPLDAVGDIRVVADPWPELWGTGRSAPGSLRGVCCCGRNGDAFAVAYRHRPAVVVALAPGWYPWWYPHFRCKRLVVCTPDPHATVARLAG
jgi:hypothetical protein